MNGARDKHLICYRCRKAGHSAQNCTNVVPDDNADGVGTNIQQSKKKQQKKESGGNICYKCGSNEHRIQQCPKLQGMLQQNRNKKGIDFGRVGDLPFANCYVCNKSGHLASHCPESNKGAYPQGGACRECGSVDHYVADCPEKKKKKKKGSNNESDDNDADVTIDQYLEEAVEKDEKPKKKSTTKKRKVVNF